MSPETGAGTRRAAVLHLESRRIAADSPPFIIAELSGNHAGFLDRALALVEVAAANGAHAVKLQTYTADTMTLDLDSGEFFITDPKSLWKGTSLHALYGKAYTPWEWHESLFRRIRELGLVGFSTPFDETAVDFLESLNVPCYKIASFENTDIPLIKKVAATGKPIFISTGMATAEELHEAVGCARTAGCRDIVLLKCTSTYPADPADSNLLTIPDLRAEFGCEVGLSDHTLGTSVAVAAVALGAVAVEKHLTIDRNDGAVDSAFSLEPAELRQLVTDTATAWRSLGVVNYGPTKAEERAVAGRRSIYVAKDLKKGEVLTKENIRCIRPGLGLAPRHYESLLGRTVNRSVSKGTPMSWELVD